MTKTASRTVAPMSDKGALSHTNSPDTGTRRPLLFVPHLRTMLDALSPPSDTDPAPVDFTVYGHPRAQEWRTVRVRPEIMAGIELISDHVRTSGASNGRQLSVSEALAVALTVALPVVLSGEDQ